MTYSFKQSENWSVRLTVGIFRGLMLARGRGSLLGAPHSSTKMRDAIEAIDRYRVSSAYTLLISRTRVEISASRQQRLREHPRGGLALRRYDHRGYMVPSPF